MTFIMEQLVKEFKLFQEKSRLIEEQVEILNNKINRIESERYGTTLNKAQNFVTSVKEVTEEELSSMNLEEETATRIVLENSQHKHLLEATPNRLAISSQC